MRSPTLVLAPLALAFAACSERPASSTFPKSNASVFLVTNVQTRLENRCTEGSGPTALSCGELWTTYAFDELSGIGARILRQETSVVERDGGTRPVRTRHLDLAVPARGRAVATTVWELCGQPATDFPARLEVEFTIRDDRGNETRVRNGTLLAAF